MESIEPCRLRPNVTVSELRCERVTMLVGELVSSGAGAGATARKDGEEGDDVVMMLLAGAGEGLMMLDGAAEVVAAPSAVGGGSAVVEDCFRSVPAL